jgi:diketogulonate reductase-like aldo/keto reductase
VWCSYSPLGGLSGAPVLSNPTVIGVGKAHNKSSAQTALRWVNQQGVVAVTSASNPKYLAYVRVVEAKLWCARASRRLCHDVRVHVRVCRSDLQIFDFSLSEDEMQELAAI